MRLGDLNRDRFNRTPRDDREFTTPGDQGEQNRMDLLRVLMHEMGHVKGLDHPASAPFLV